MYTHVQYIYIYICVLYKKHYFCILYKHFVKSVACIPGIGQNARNKQYLDVMKLLCHLKHSNVFCFLVF